jgi:periplasmic mercuric ion binding protein
MKTAKLILAIVLLAALGLNSSAQTVTKASVQQKTETFKVWGKCGMCKTRIEKTVKTEGVTSADWDTKTNLLTVTFDPAQTNIDVLGKKLSSVGHDTEKYKAPDDVYAKLPGCCHYERSK